MEYSKLKFILPFYLDQKFNLFMTIYVIYMLLAFLILPIESYKTEIHYALLLIISKISVAEILRLINS